MEKIIVKNPNQDAEVVEVETIDLECLQKFVGGYIECVYIPQLEKFGDGLSCFCNEEGKLIGLEKNFVLADEYGKPYDYVVGAVVFCGCDDEGESIGLTDDQITTIKDYFNDTCKPKYVSVQVGFINKEGKEDETELDIEVNDEEKMTEELDNLIKSLKDELGIVKITYIEQA